MQPSLERGRDEWMYFSLLDISLAHAEKFRFFCCECVVILARGSRIADKFILLVQPYLTLHVQRRLTHRKGPTVSSVSDEMCLMNRPRTSPRSGKSSLEEIPNLRRFVVFVCHSFNALYELVEIYICHNCPRSDDLIVLA
jgi:hypothetical protein